MIGLKLYPVYQLQCKMDGRWTDWAHTACSMTCGEETGIRTRTCTNPASVGCGVTCPGADAEDEATNGILGPVNMTQISLVQYLKL